MAKSEIKSINCNGAAMDQIKTIKNKMKKMKMKTKTTKGKPHQTLQERQNSKTKRNLSIQLCKKQQSYTTSTKEK